MKTIIPKICLLALLVTTFVVLRIREHRGKLPDILLDNLEALAEGEDSEDGYSEKFTRTWQEGPYGSGDNKYYIVNSLTICSGIGVVDCEPDGSSEIVKCNSSN